MKRYRKGALLGLFIVLLNAAGAWQVNGANIPTRPENNAFTSDFAGLINGQDKRSIANVQKQAYTQHSVPIIVVTITTMGEYGGVSIESLAHEWFNTWQIGTLGLKGSRRANKGILLLVSLGDRKARIELGADWGRLWDNHAQSIMDKAIIPRFKKRQYSEGIREGVKALGRLAAQDPSSKPPEPSFWQKVTDFKTKSNNPLSPFSIGVTHILVIGGIVFIVLSFFYPENRGLFLKIGIGLIVAALFLYIIFAILAMFARGKSGGGFGSGGGFSGGFSGGGGASGSW